MEKYINKIDKILELIQNQKVIVAQNELKNLKEDIIYDMAFKKCKGKADKEQLKYARLLLKSAKQDTTRTFMHTMYKIDNTYQILDGFVAVVLNEPIAGLEVKDYEEGYFDCRTVINRANKNYFEYDYNYKKVDVDLLEMEQLVLKNKKSKPPYPTETLCHKYNTYYSPLRLLIAIKILGTNNVDIYFHTSSEKDPIYLKSDLGEAIVLPITVQ